MISEDSALTDKTEQEIKKLIERQIALEESYITAGINRSRALVRDAIEGGNVTTLPVAQRLIASAYDTVAAELDAIKATKSSGVGGRYRVFLRLIPTDVLSVIALTTCLNMMVSVGNHSNYSTAQAVMSTLGRAVQAELLSIQLSTVAPAYMNRVYEYLKERNTTSGSHILKTLRASAENVHFQHEPWPNSQCIAVGRFLMQAAYATGMFKWERSTDGTQLIYLMPSDNVMQILEDVVQNADAVTRKPPMLLPPNEHDTLFSGGYLTGIDRRGTYRNSQITRKMTREVAEAFRTAAPLKQALNKAQNVPYRINKAILDLINKARAAGVNTGMPGSTPAPKPQWRLDGVPKDEYDEHTLDEFQGWKSLMREWYSKERTRVGQLRGMATLLQMAEEFKDEPALYFPTCVDWRYRLYFKSSLHPQGSDLQKAVLEFGTGKPLGDRGLFWLKVHVATCFGYDKALFENRAAWVDANIEILRSMVRAPFDSDAFRGADSPWCFLAAAIDLVNALDSGSPTEHVSHIPVAMDATNSGSQHYSAMLRDPIGGRLTNLFWEGNEEKADMYMDVKQRTDSKVIMDLDNLDTVVQATYWRENAITRSMTKRPCMTYVYSATVRSCSEYVYQGAKEEGYDGTDEFSLWKLAGYLSPRMREAVEEANPAAAAAMRYLQQLTRRIPATGHLQFKTPLGGLVINRYTASEETSVRVNSMNLTTLLAYNRNYDICNKRKAASGIAPNFVHSLDSTHLMMVINAFDGDIVPIHDSLATHACDVDAMHKAIREQFVKLYEEVDPLIEVTKAAAECGADLTDLYIPEKGDLNLQLVKDSPFFFC